MNILSIPLRKRNRTMKEISIEEFGKKFNPFTTRENPAIALACDGNRTNGLTIGWAEYGTLWRKKAATIYVHKQRFTKEILDKAQYYSICYIEDKDQLKYFGTVSGRDENKIKKCGMKLNTEEPAPYFEESKYVIICKIMGQSDFDANSVDEDVSEWYKRDGVHTLYYGEVLKVLEG